MNPFERVLQLAAERVFSPPPNLAVPLTADPSITLYLLSQQPENFGRLIDCADNKRRRKNLENLLTAARAYVVARRKPVAHAVIN